MYKRLAFLLPLVLGACGVADGLLLNVDPVAWCMKEYTFYAEKERKQHCETTFLAERRGMQQQAAAQPRTSSIMDVQIPIPAYSQRQPAASTGSQYSAPATPRPAPSLAQGNPGLSNERQGSSSSKRQQNFDGQVTQHCVRYAALKRDGTSSWFSFTNGCAEMIRVWYGNAGTGYMGSLMELRPGQTDRSWFLNTRYNGVEYIACRAKVNGQDVFLDKKANSCYWWSR